MEFSKTPEPSFKDKLMKKVKKIALFLLFILFSALSSQKVRATENLRNSHAGRPVEARAEERCSHISPSPQGRRNLSRSPRGFSSRESLSSVKSLSPKERSDLNKLSVRRAPTTTRPAASVRDTFKSLGEFAINQLNHQDTMQIALRDEFNKRAIAAVDANTITTLVADSLEIKMEGGYYP